MRFFGNYIYTLIKLVIYTLFFDVFHPAGAFEMHKCDMHRIPNGFKIFFHMMENLFSQFIFIEKYLQFKKIDHPLNLRCNLVVCYVNSRNFRL